MQKRIFILTILMAALLVACSAETPEPVEKAETQDPPAPAAAENDELVEYLFVQHAKSGTLKDGLLTLEGVRDDILFFSDRPDRIVGRESLEDFIEAWDDGENSFAVVPPNAIVTTLRDGEALDLALVLKEPVLTGRTLVYKAEVLDGPESTTGTNVGLFIDAFGGRIGGMLGGIRESNLGERALGREAQRAQRMRGGEPGMGGRGGEPGMGGRRGRAMEGRRAHHEPRGIHRGGGGYNQGPEIR